MATITVYGIPNCDTTQKAITFLKKQKVDFTFHDYKQQGISKEKLESWGKKAGWETIFNKRSTTWRELSEAEQNKVVDLVTAIPVMMEHNSIIKRPVIEIGKEIVVGYNEKAIQGAIT